MEKQLPRVAPHARRAKANDLALAALSAAIAGAGTWEALRRPSFALVGVILACSLFGAHLFRRAGRRPPPPEARYRLDLDPDRIRVVHPQRKLEQIRWEDVREVLVATTAEGPFAPDVWFVLVGAGTAAGASFPSGATGSEALVSWLLGLPDFDHAAFIGAMGCTSERVFPCWKGEGLAPPGQVVAARDA